MPLLGVTLDTGHLTVAGDDAAVAVAALGDRLFAVHLKDVEARTGLARWLPHRPRLRSCLLGTGRLDLGGVLAALAHAGFTGSVAIEDERPELPLSELQASLRAGSRLLRAVSHNGAQPSAF